MNESRRKGSSRRTYMQKREAVLEHLGKVISIKHATVLVCAFAHTGGEIELRAT